MPNDEPARVRRSLAVLVVEDEFLIAMDVEMLLERNGHRVIGPATSIGEANRLLETADPDIALLDVNVGGKLVTPLAEELQRRNIPFVLISAYASMDFDGSALLARAINVGKPIDERRLIAALSQALR